MNLVPETPTTFTYYYELKTCLIDQIHFCSSQVKEQQSPKSHEKTSPQISAGYKLANFSTSRIRLI